MDWGRTLGAVEPWLAALVDGAPPVRPGEARQRGTGIGKRGRRGAGDVPAHRDVHDKEERCRNKERVRGPATRLHGGDARWSKGAAGPRPCQGSCRATVWD